MTINEIINEEINDQLMIICLLYTSDAADEVSPV